MVGLGCAPIYPSIIHETPTNFGAGLSQALIGMQMAFAYVGTNCNAAIIWSTCRKNGNLAVSFLPIDHYAAYDLDGGEAE